MTNRDNEACESRVNKNEIVELLAALVRADSSNPPGNEREVARIVQKKFEEYGMHSQVDDLDGINRANLVARLTGAGSSPHLVYCAHADVVPAAKENWTHDPFRGEIEGNLMYGRGTVDMKSGLAAMAMSLCILKKAGIKLNGSLALVLTAGEEVHFFGSREYVKKYGVEDIDALAISEPTNNEVCLAERGGLWIKFIARGRTAHGGLPEKGVNALLQMLKFLEVFRLFEFPVQPHPLLGKPSLSVTTLHAGRNTNVIPDHCEATVDMRTIPYLPHGKILSAIDDIIKTMREKDPAFRIEYEILNNHDPIETEKDEPFVQTAFEIHRKVFGRRAEPGGVHYMTDAVSFLDKKRIPLVICGPGDPNLNHQPDEHVDLIQVVDSVRFYTALAVNFLK